MQERVPRWVQSRARMLSLILGSTFIGVWTLLRFFTQKSIFDLVSQQVIVHQWLHGTMTPAHMGQAAYIPKMVLLYVPLDLLPGEPRLKLLALTLIINIAVFILIAVALERILRLFNVQGRTALSGALVWFSAIAGSVFWIAFINSRNLEVAGGLFWIYAGLRYLQQPTWRLRIICFGLGSLLFFSDPLQLYMSALPVLIYGCVLVVAKKQLWRPLLELLLTTALAYLGAQALCVASRHALQLSFTDTSTAVHISPSLPWVLESIRGAIKSLISLFAGAADAGRVRELANLTVLVGAMIFLVHGFIVRSIPRRLLLLICTLFAVDVLVYIASDQARQGAATMRYLIMLGPVATLAMGCLRPPRKLVALTGASMGAVILINAGALGTALLKHWDPSFSSDAHLASTYRYLTKNPTYHVYASDDTSLPLLYYYNLPASKALPIACRRGNLVQTHYSMDAAFNDNKKRPLALAAIVFDQASIVNRPNYCTPSTASWQWGTPIATDHTDDGSQVVLYRQSTVRLPR